MPQGNFDPGQIRDHAHRNLPITISHVRQAFDTQPDGSICLGSAEVLVGSIRFRAYLGRTSRVIFPEMLGDAAWQLAVAETVRRAVLGGAA